MSVKRRIKHVSVIGAGPVGALQACYLARRGFDVDIYEAREDVRITKAMEEGRNINIVMHYRAAIALENVGLAEQVFSETFPNNQVIYHSRDGNAHSFPLGNNRTMNIAHRTLINQALLTAADQYRNVTIHFKHKLLRCDFDAMELVLLGPNGDEMIKKTDFICGCDGAYSTVRQNMMRVVRFEYLQTYLNEGFMQFIIPSKNNEYALDPTGLHIWPRDPFMHIAFTNIDHTFTSWILIPFGIYDQIKTTDQWMDFWNKDFRDVVPLIGEDKLREAFLKYKLHRIISIKCHPYHYEDKCMIMGDASHAMSPYFGQGLSLGMEDCLVFDELLDKHDNNFGNALSEFTDVRHPDMVTMADITKMKGEFDPNLVSLSNRFWYRLDLFLDRIMPKTYIPLHVMLSFSRMRQSKIFRRMLVQNMVLNVTLFSMVAAVTSVVGYIVWKKKLFRLL